MAAVVILILTSPAGVSTSSASRYLHHRRQLQQPFNSDAPKRYEQGNNHTHQLKMIIVFSRS